MSEGELVDAQFHLESRIEKTYSNFKKDGKPKMTFSNCKTRMQNLRELWVRFEANHDQLLKLKGHNYFEKDFFDQVEQLYLEKLGEFQTFLDSIVVNPQTQSTPLHEISNSTAVVREEPERLPKIAIPTFSGQYKDWKSFNDLFMFLVVNKPNVSNVTKMHYLKSSISGDAEQLLSSYSITDDNFNEAWEKLKS